MCFASKCALLRRASERSRLRRSATSLLGLKLSQMNSEATRPQKLRLVVFHTGLVCLPVGIRSAFAGGVQIRRRRNRLNISLQFWKLKPFQVWKGRQRSEAMHHPRPGAAEWAAVAAEVDSPGGACGTCWIDWTGTWLSSSPPTKPPPSQSPRSSSSGMLSWCSNPDLSHLTIITQIYRHYS